MTTVTQIIRQAQELLAHSSAAPVPKRNARGSTRHCRLPRTRVKPAVCTTRSSTCPARHQRPIPWTLSSPPGA